MITKGAIMRKAILIIFILGSLFVLPVKGYGWMTNDLVYMWWESDAYGEKYGTITWQVKNGITDFCIALDRERLIELVDTWGVTSVVDRNSNVWVSKFTFNVSDYISPYLKYENVEIVNSDAKFGFGEGYDLLYAVYHISGDSSLFNNDLNIRISNLPHDATEADFFHLHPLYKELWDYDSHFKVNAVVDTLNNNRWGVDLVDNIKPGNKVLPEPATVFTMGSGFLALIGLGRRKSKKSKKKQA